MTPNGHAPRFALDRPPEKIAVFRALFLGDLLMTVPSFRALHTLYPQAEITLVGLPWASAFVPRVPRYIHRFAAFPGYPGLPEQDPWIEEVDRFFAEQRSYGYDLALQMHGDGNISNEVVRRLGARHTLGFGQPGDDRLTWTLPLELGEPEWERWLGLVGTLGAPTNDPSYELDVRPEDEARAASLLAEAPPGDGPLVLLHVGSKDPSRRWPPERFAAVADALVERRGARIVLTGSEGERQMTSETTCAMRSPALDLAGRTDLGAFAAVIARSDLLVANDTGASHVAGATGTPSVVLFGWSRPHQFMPPNRTLHRAVDALDGAEPRDAGEAALMALPPERVIAECEAALSATWHARGAAAVPAGAARTGARDAPR